MAYEPEMARRHAGAVSWPQLLGVIGVVLLGLWLYQRHLANKTYGSSVIANSITVLKTGIQQVEMAVYDTGSLPKNAEAAGFTPYSQSIGTSDRTVQLRLDMHDAGELKLNYDGWIFRSASLTLTPILGKNTLSWKCTPIGIPADLIQEWCARFEQNVGTVSIEDPSVAAAAKAARDASDAEMIASAPKLDLWQPPFSSRGPLTGAAVEIAEVLRKLEPFQWAALEYFTANQQLPSGGAEFEATFTPALQQLKTGIRNVTVGFGPGADIIVQIDGLASQQVALRLSAYVIPVSNLLEWQCIPWEENEAVELPPECKPPG